MMKIMLADGFMKSLDKLNNVTYFDKVKRFFKKIRKTIKWTYNYLKYAWTIGDDDWDYGYLYAILKWKMDRMADCIETNEIIESNHRVAKQLRYAVYLINRLENGVDEEAAMKVHTDKWGESRMVFMDSGELKFEYDTVNSPEEKEQCDKEVTEAYQAGSKAKEKTKHRLFRHIEKYIERWWD